MLDAHHTTLYTTAQRLLAFALRDGLLGRLPPGHGSPFHTPLAPHRRLLDIAMWHHAISCPGNRRDMRWTGLWLSLPDVQGRGMFCFSVTTEVWVSMLTHIEVVVAGASFSGGYLAAASSLAGWSPDTQDQWMTGQAPGKVKYLPTYIHTSHTLTLVHKPWVMAASNARMETFSSHLSYSRFFCIYLRERV